MSDQNLAPRRTIRQPEPPGVLVVRIRQGVRAIPLTGDARTDEILKRWAEKAEQRAAA